VRFLRATSRAISRFNDWIGPTAAASSLLKSGGLGGGAQQVDPVGLHMLERQLDEDAKE
jgi:hypothetical protein